MLRRTTDDRGASAVEFAFLLPLLILLTFGIVEFGRAYNTQVVLTNAAREGARVMSVTGNQSDAQDRAEDAASGNLSGGTVTAAVTTCDDPDIDGDGNPGDKGYDYTTANVSVPFDLNIPIWGSGTITITGRATLSCE